MNQYPSPRLEVRHYVLLQHVNKLGSMAAAADALGVTPSAVTHRIREAERRLGIALTARIGTQVQLTLSGQRLAHAADRAVDEMFRAEFDAIRIGRGAGSIVRVGMATYSFFHWLPAFLGRVATVDPSIQVEIVGEAVSEPLSVLQSNTVDVILVPGPVKKERRVALFPMQPDELVCITSPTHRLADRSFVEADDLTTDTHLTYSSVITEGFEYDRFFRPSGRYPARLVPLAVPEAVQELVAANLGISVLSKWAAQPRLMRNEIAGIRLNREGISLQWHAAIREIDANGSPALICAQILTEWPI